MDLNILDVAPVLTDVSICIAFLRGRNLLLSDFFCCNQLCAKVHDASLTDKEIFQCYVCCRRTSIRHESFWSKSKLSLCLLIGILYFFSNGSSITDLLRFFAGKITKPTAIQWYNYFRDIMTTYMTNHPVTFSNCTVHIDETFIWWKTKIC